MLFKYIVSFKLFLCTYFTILHDMMKIHLLDRSIFCLAISNLIAIENGWEDNDITKFLIENSTFGPISFSWKYKIWLYQLVTCCIQDIKWGFAAVTTFRSIIFVGDVQVLVLWVMAHFEGNFMGHGSLMKQIYGSWLFRGKFFNVHRPGVTLYFWPVPK